MARQKKPQVGVSKHGTGFRIRWVDEDGKRRSETFRDERTAAKERSRRVVQADEIRRGLRKREQVRSMNEVCDLWLVRRASRKRSQRDDESIIKSHVRPVLGKLMIGEFTPAHGELLAEARAHLAPKTLHNVVTLVQSLLNFACTDVRWLEHAPRLRKPKIPRRSADYNFLRTPQEIAAYLGAAKMEGDVVHALYATAIYTGARAGELAGLRWSDVDFDRRLITIARSFEEPTKSNEIRHVPILDPLLPVLRAWRLRHPGALVFTNRDGNMLGKSARIFQEVHARVLKRAGLSQRPHFGNRLHYITFHDLRHTFASHWAANGGDVFKLQRVLGHASIDQTMRYAHLTPDAFASEYGRLGAALATKVASIFPLPIPPPQSSATTATVVAEEKEQALA